MQFSLSCELGVVEVPLTFRPEIPISGMGGVSVGESVVDLKNPPAES